MLLSPFQPLAVFFLSLLVQVRHIFYGLTMLKKYRGRGLMSLYLIYSICDETFSINCSAEVPENIDEGWFMFFVSLLDQSYWVLSVTLGSIIGGALTKYSEGVEFVMTSMFSVIFIRSMEKRENRISGVIGLLSTLISLVLFGKTIFLIPSMVSIIIFLFLFKKRIEKGRGV